MRIPSNHFRLAVVALLVGCAAGGRTPVALETYRAFKAISGATAVGVSKVRYDELLQNAATEILILSDLASSAADSAILQHYSQALDNYKDAATLWAEQISTSQDEWMPEGRIFLTGAISPLVAKYQLETASHTVPRTNSQFQTVPSSSIQTVWLQAGREQASADSVLLPAIRATRR